MNSAPSLVDAPSLPDIQVQATAGPSKPHILLPEEDAYVREAAGVSHRSGFAKELTDAANGGVRRMLGIEQDDESWHIVHTKGGTEAMTAAILAGCPMDGRTLLVNSDNFSKVALSIMKDAGRPVETIDFERGDALQFPSEQFEQIAGMVERGEVDTVYLTENGTTTGTNQRRAIEELVRRRNTADSKTIIIVDGVSTDMIGAEREALPDAIFTGGQKDMGVGGYGYGVMAVNDDFLVRSRELKERGQYVGGKLAIANDAGKGENQTINTPSMAGLARARIILDRFRGTDSERWRDVGEMQRDVRAMLDESMREGELGNLGYGWLTQEPGLRSVTSHVIRVPQDIVATRIVAALAQAGIAISGGYGKVGKQREIRPCIYSPNTMGEAEDIASALAKVTREIRA